ncbi:putative bifunctional diguanylate cyclase/phosphodiesterase [Pseudogemmobacter sonorensis]|uniref:putative bifunctional diguanylate cyclase/phosphodiesterase n=1 Tax=Pseudogemmobacter sonorensis TaxID=2989681 RepID=UPI0036C96C34
MSLISRSPGLRRILGRLALVRRPEFLIFLPAITLAGFWAGGELVLLGLAIGLPLLFALTGPAPRRAAGPAGGEELSVIGRAIAVMNHILPGIEQSGRNTACIVVQFDELDRLLRRCGRAAQDEVLSRSAERIKGILRTEDFVSHLQGGGIAIVLTPVQRLDLETMIQLAARLQAAVAEPLSLGGGHIHVTCSVGFCIGGRSDARTGRSLLDAAQAAADEALRHGPGAIRAYSADMARRRAARDALRDRLEAALGAGEIRAHFQPQVSTDSGEISGMEALARWYHPERGLLSPGEFLPAIESSDMLDRLGGVMLVNALAALAEWDAAGLHVPSASVNFSASELRNPRLPERIRCELERFDLAPARLTIEILETVIAQTDNDVIVSNIAQLARMGCGVDLDDFGTGHASIAAIRRFTVRRLKIDRSFVTRCDTDREQQRMVAGIVALAEQLGLATLAEGVETAPENAMLCQIGCGHLQGYGIARPMPLKEAGQWISRHQTRPDRIPRIGRRGP